MQKIKKLRMEDIEIHAIVVEDVHGQSGEFRLVSGTKTYKETSKHGATFSSGDRVILVCTYSEDSGVYEVFSFVNLSNGTRYLLDAKPLFSYLNRIIALCVIVGIATCFLVFPAFIAICFIVYLSQQKRLAQKMAEYVYDANGYLEKVTPDADAKAIHEVWETYPGPAMVQDAIG